MGQTANYTFWIRTESGCTSGDTSLGWKSRGALLLLFPPRSRFRPDLVHFLQHVDRIHPEALEDLDGHPLPFDPAPPRSSAPAVPRIHPLDLFLPDHRPVPFRPRHRPPLLLSGVAPVPVLSGQVPGLPGRP